MRSGFTSIDPPNAPNFVSCLMNGGKVPLHQWAEVESDRSIARSRALSSPNTLDLWVGSTCSQSVNISLSERHTNIPGASHRKYRHPWIELVFPLSYHWRCVVQLIRWPYLYGGSRKTVPPQNVAKQHQQFFDGAITKSCIKIHHSHGLKFHRSHLPAQQPEPHVPGLP